MKPYHPPTNLTCIIWRNAYPDRSDLDRVDWVVHSIGDDGSVSVRPFTLDDLVPWAERLMERAS